MERTLLAPQPTFAGHADSERKERTHMAVQNVGATSGGMPPARADDNRVVITLEFTADDADRLRQLAKVTKTDYPETIRRAVLYSTQMAEELRKAGVID